MKGMEWIPGLAGALLFGSFSAMFWIWGGILYYAVLMDSRRQKPPSWMLAFFTKPLRTISVDNQLKAFNFMRGLSVVLFMAFVALGVVLVRADYGQGWSKGVQASLSYFLPLAVVWFGLVIWFERYARKASAPKSRL